MAVRTAAVLGAGIVPDLPLFHAVEALRSGQLKTILEGWRCHLLHALFMRHRKPMKKDGYAFFLTGWRTVNKRHLINYVRNFLSSMVNDAFLNMCP